MYFFILNRNKNKEIYLIMFYSIFHSHISFLSDKRILNNYRRVAGIEPAYSPWQGGILPLNHTRKLLYNIYIYVFVLNSQSFFLDLTLILY